MSASRNRRPFRRRTGGRRRGALRGVRAVPVPRVGDARTSCAGSSVCSSPARAARIDGSERWSMRTECIVDPGATPMLTVRIRCLQVQHRAVECAVAGGSRLRRDGPARRRRHGATCRGTRRSSTSSTSPRRRCRRSSRRRREHTFRLPAGADFETVRHATAESDASSGASSAGGRRSTDASGSWAEHDAGRPREDHGRRREHHRLVARPSAARRDHQSLARRRAHDAGRRRRRLRVVARPARGRPCRGGGLRERRHVPGARSAAATSCSRRRSSSTTSRRSLPRAPAISTTRPRSTRSSRSAC